MMNWPGAVKRMKEALFYSSNTDGIVNCGLCQHRCSIKPGRRGVCGVRENRDGTLYTLVYGRLVAEHVDPIEKKPLFHFMPGSKSYSVSTVGCNFQCLHCQNYQISQYPQQADPSSSGRERTALSVAETAGQAGCASISYTYVEPTVFYEFSRDCAREAAGKGIKNVYVSNGYMTPEVVKDIAPYLDGANIDLKSFQDSFYRKVCKARLQPVLDTIVLMHQLGIWVEVTTLVIPGHNDSPEELGDIAKFISSVSPSIPWHVSAFRPTFRMTDRPSTSRSTLQTAYDIGRDTGLHYVYQGNIPGAGETTFCPGCGEMVIERYGFSLQNNRLEGGSCAGCSTPIAGFWR